MSKRRQSIKRLKALLTEADKILEMQSFCLKDASRLVYELRMKCSQAYAKVIEQENQIIDLKRQLAGMDKPQETKAN